MVFSVTSEWEKNICMSYGLNLFGRHAKVVPFKAWNTRTQCYRCHGFGHDPARCKEKVACGLCGRNHFTKSHKCRKCGLRTTCEHLKPRCTNCPDKQHSPISPECPVVQIHKGELATRDNTNEQ